MFRVAVALVLVSALVLAVEEEDTGKVEHAEEDYEVDLFPEEEEYDYFYVDDSSTTPAPEDGEGTTVKPDLPL